MTTQEAYDRIREFFTRDGAVFAISATSICVYRGDGDPASPLRCAVGCLIPDDLYTRSIEHKAVDAFTDEFEALGLDGVEVSFLVAAQSLHDSIATRCSYLDRVTDEWVGPIEDATVERYVIELDRYAAHIGLTVPA